LQLPIKQWHDAIGEKTIADAVLDRTVYNAGCIELKGESLGKSYNKRDAAAVD
jgi:DNA replication protein DnaC